MSERMPAMRQWYALLGVNKLITKTNKELAF